jgi:hypothetical protein
MALLFAGTLTAWAFFFYRYYQRQNGLGAAIGGPISRAKILWLGLTTYCYFVLPPILYAVADLPAVVRHLTLVFMCLLGLRACMQMLLMFVLHRWSPPMGMSLNILYSGIMIWQLQKQFPLLQETGPLQIIPGLWIGLMLTDTIFAWKFFKIVGARTQGTDAIWYASEAPEFAAINRLTWVADLFFYLYLASVVVAVTNA